MEKPSYRDYVKLVWQQFRGRGLVAAIFATLAFVLAVAWAITANGELEPWVSLSQTCALIAAALASIRYAMLNRIDTGNERDRYSLSYALAYGYVHNFLAGAVDALKAEAHPGKIFVYRPANLGEIDPQTHEAFKKELERRGFQLSTRTLDKNSNRPRGILSVYLPANTGGSASRTHFVDFPTTLLTLSSLIAYQAARAADEDKAPWSEDYRNQMARTYIDHFFRELSTQADKAGIREWIDFTDMQFKNLQI